MERTFFFLLWTRSRLKTIKDEKDARRFELEVCVKTSYVIVWCHVSLSIKNFTWLQKTLKIIKGNYNTGIKDKDISKLDKG